MISKDQRKMLFLYPQNLVACELSQIRDIMTLTEDLGYIVNEVNDFVKKISENYLIQSAHCLPKVECVSITDFDKIVNEFHNVRVCLVNFNNYNYDSIYDKVVSTYKHNRQDISHLISLSVDSRMEDGNTVWETDKRKRFDVNIKTNLNQLKIVLISIMMDIIFYRHFNLSTELAERKTFSKLKKSYILNKVSNSKDVQQYYNSVLSDLNKVNYLSICYPEISDYFIKRDIEIGVLVDSLTQKYWKLIINGLFTRLKLQENYVMFDKEKRFKSFPKDMQIQISDIIPDFCRNHDIKLPVLLAIEKDLFKESNCFVINNIDDFLNLKTDAFNYYNLDFSI